jgi:toxin ParE1/3/4
MKVILSPEALDDLQETIDWIMADNPDRARSFAAELRAKCVDLSFMPNRFPIARDGSRGVIRKRVYGDYLIFYVVGDDHVDVARIIHGARDWLEILGNS